MKAMAPERAEGRRIPGRSSMRRSPGCRSGYREPVVLCYLEGLERRGGCAAARLSARHRSFAVVTGTGPAAREADPPRTGVAPGLDCSGGCRPEATAMPAALLEATVQTSLGFVSHSSTAMPLGATTPAGLAKGVLHAMMISRLKVTARWPRLLAAASPWGPGRSYTARAGRLRPPPPAAHEARQAAESGASRVNLVRQARSSTRRSARSDGAKRLQIPDRRRKGRKVQSRFSGLNKERRSRRMSCLATRSRRYRINRRSWV